MVTKINRKAERQRRHTRVRRKNFWNRQMPKIMCI